MTPQAIRAPEFPTGRDFAVGRVSVDHHGTTQDTFISPESEIPGIATDWRGR